MTNFTGVASDEMPDAIAHKVQSMIDLSIMAAQVVINRSITEGQTVTLPTTNSDIVLNLLTGGASLNAVNVVLPGNVNGRVGQRVFVNSNGQIANASFKSTNAVNNPDYMFNPGDNCVYFRNNPTTFSRITS